MSSPRDALSVVILAAGRGKRMRSKHVKLVHPVAGRPMVSWVAHAARALKPSRSVAVVGHQADAVRAALDGEVDGFALQSEQRGTGHAVVEAFAALPELERSTVLIVNGDLPTLRTATLRAVLAKHRRSKAALTLLTAQLDDPSGYGRILRSPHGAITRIVEDRDADPAERAVSEINVGLYCAHGTVLLPLLKGLKPDNAQGEYYLTDAVHAAIAREMKVVAICHTDAAEVLGVNDRSELARASRTVFERKADELLASGVTLLDPARTWVDPRARIGRDTILYPEVHIEGETKIGEDCRVYSGTRIASSKIGRGVTVLDHCVLNEVAIADDVQVGPFAHLRPGARLDHGVKVGNFVEVKKSRLRAGVKASHLSYLGDADIGERSNIGAGTITCNYDGKKKMPTVLGKDVFIGSDTQLVAPVNVGEGAYVGAGSTVTEDVPPGALALSRVRQLNLEGWVERRRSSEGSEGRSRGSASASEKRAPGGSKSRKGSR